MTFRCVALSVLFAASAGLAQAASEHTRQNPASIRWVLHYDGKSTDQFMWDTRAKKLVNTRVPAMLADSLLMALGGTPDPVVVVKGRYISMSGCRYQSCSEKGFLWLDTQTGIGVGAFHASDTLHLGSNSLSANHLPTEAKLALWSWLYEQSLRTASAEFIDRSNRQHALDIANFNVQEHFHEHLHTAPRRPQ
jgi:hypothetical protein